MRSIITYINESNIIDDLMDLYPQLSQLHILNDITTEKYCVIDTETANHNGYLCLFAAVLVINNKIVDSKNWYIMPPNLEFDKWNTDFHSISKETIKGAPYLNEIWDEIYSYIKGNILVFHNKGADLSNIKKSLNYYDISHELEYFDVRDTYEYYHYSLDVVCKTLGVVNRNPHNALDDATATAECFIKFLEGILLNSLKAKDFKNLRSQNKKKNFFRGSHTQITTSNRQILSSNEVLNKSTIFYRKKVVISGIFDKFERNEVANIVKKLGGKVNSSISGVTDYLICGKDAGSSKLNLVKKSLELGIHPILLMTEDDFDNVINGNTIDLSDLEKRFNLI